MAEITRKAFKAWLESHGPREVVGLTGTDIHTTELCPLANCFGGEFGHEGWYSEEFAGPSPLPDWALLFMQRVDACGKTRITASRALSILESIE